MMNSGASHQRKQRPRKSIRKSIRTPYERCVAFRIPSFEATPGISVIRHGLSHSKNGPWPAVFTQSLLWKMDQLSIKLVIFHSYVSLPDGNLQQIASSRRKSVGHMKTMELSLALSRGPMVASFFFCWALNDKFSLGCPNLASPRTSYAMMNGPTLW